MPNWQKDLGQIRGQLKDLGQKTRETFRQETQRYRNYGQSLQKGVTQGVHQGVNQAKDATVKTLKKQLKNTPIYTYKVLRTGVMAGWGVVKIVAKTPLGTEIKKLIIFTGTGYIILNLGYIYGVGSTEDVVILHRYQRMASDETDGLTGYMFKDDQNRIFRITNSAWYGQLYAPETWADIVEHTHYRIKYYGIRIAWLQIYPNVISMIPIDEQGEEDPSRGYHQDKLGQLRDGLGYLGRKAHEKAKPHLDQAGKKAQETARPYWEKLPSMPSMPSMPSSLPLPGWGSGRKTPSPSQTSSSSQIPLPPETKIEDWTRMPDLGEPEKPSSSP